MMECFDHCFPQFGPVIIRWYMFFFIVSPIVISLPWVQSCILGWNRVLGKWGSSCWVISRHLFSGYPAMSLTTTLSNQYLSDDVRMTCICPMWQCKELRDTMHQSSNRLDKAPPCVPITWQRPWKYVVSPMLKPPVDLSQNEKGANDIKRKRPRGKGRKLAWQETSHENTMMLRMGMLPNVLPVATYRWCPGGDWATAKLLLNQPAGGV